MASDSASPAIVFDIGGVLLDWNPRHLYGKLFDDAAAMESFLTTVCNHAWNAGMDAGRPFAEATAALAAEHPDQADLIEAYHHRWPEMVKDALWDTVDILRTLKDERVPLFALTNFSHETWPLMLDRFDFLHWFGDVVVSGAERVIKPDPRIYAVLIARTGRAPEDLLFIDDNGDNVAAARDAGIQAVQFTSAEALRAELLERGFRV